VEQQQYLLLQEHMDKAGITPLLSISPDSWKNIAYPVIEGFNLLIAAQVRHFQRTHELGLQVDANHRQMQAHLAKLEKDLRRREDQLEDNSLRIEKNITIAFNKFRVDLENSIQRSEIRVEEGYNQVQRKMAAFEDKLGRVEETAEVKQWVQGLVDMRQDALQYRIDESKKNLQQ